jgi:hypothetical protein
MAKEEHLTRLSEHAEARAIVLGKTGGVLAGDEDLVEGLVAGRTTDLLSVVVQLCVPSIPELLEFVSVLVDVELFGHP